MNDKVLFNELTELAERLGISVRNENICTEDSSGCGGLCRLEGKYLLILNSKATPEEKNQVMIKALKQFDLGVLYVKPFIRELIEGYTEF